MRNDWGTSQKVNILNSLEVVPRSDVHIHCLWDQGKGLQEYIGLLFSIQKYMNDLKLHEVGDDGQICHFSIAKIKWLPWRKFIKCEKTESKIVRIFHEHFEAPLYISTSYTDFVLIGKSH